MMLLPHQDNKNKLKIEQDQVFFMNQTRNESKINNNMWIVDSSASCHMTNSPDGMKDLKDDCSKIKIRSVKTMTSKKELTKVWLFLRTTRKL